LERLGLGARLWLALIVPWRVLFDGVFAARVQVLRTGAALPVGSVPAPDLELEADVTEAERESDPTPALQLLAILQREGRLLDFLQEDVAAYSDAEVGAAARVVHQGCKRGLADYVEIESVRSEAEGAAVLLEAGFDAARTRVTGNLVGQPPFRGTLAHHGWRVAKIRLPELAEGHDPRIVAPAEVEVS
jgi:hypothetical protein